ncbi:MAG: glycosyltransferase [Ferruginibacter sp.]
MTKVVHIQFSVDSAGRAALRLQKALGSVNVSSHIVSLQYSTLVSSNIKFLGPKARFISKIDNRIQDYLTRKRVKEMGSFSYPVLGTDVSGLDEVKNADIIYIHWVLNGFFNYNSFKQVARLNKPVIIFLHDMWGITGGCHHSFTCEKYKTTGCNNCPVFPGDKINDLSAKGFKKKLKLYTKYKNLFFVSPSRWLYNCTKESLLSKHRPVFHIPNIIDTTLFKPVDKAVAKQILNIDAAETVITFGAVTVNSPYKGWVYLLKALELLKQDNSLSNVTVLIFGSGYNKEIADVLPFKTRFMGFLSDEYSISLVYNASDVFIVPSVADNLPTTVLECLSCGTPVVGFNVGGIPDMIRHRENGYLANYKDAADITNGILYCINNKIKGAIRPEFQPEVIVQKHLELYEKIKEFQPG